MKSNDPARRRSLVRLLAGGVGVLVAAHGVAAQDETLVDTGTFDESVEEPVLGVEPTTSSGPDEIAFFIDQAEMETEPEDGITVNIRLGAPSEIRFREPDSWMLYQRRNPLTSRLQEAQELIYEEKWTEAIGLIRPILREEPDNKAAQMAAMFVLAKLERDAEAIALMSKMVERWPDDYRILNNMAWVLATASDPDLRDGLRSVELARKAILRGPNDYHVWSTLAESYYVTGQFDKAVSAMESAIQASIRSRAGQDELREYRELMTKYRNAVLAFTPLR